MKVEREIIWTTPDGPPPASRPTGHLTYEPFRFRLNGAWIALVSWGTTAFVLLGALGPPWGYLAAGLCCVAGVWGARRAFRTALLVTGDGVTVKNYWKTYKFAWSEVRGVGIALRQQGVLPQPALGFSLRSGGAVFAQATPFRQTERHQFLAAVLALAPSTVEALPDTAGVIGSDRAPSNIVRLWWSRRRG
jgi:hypothetical protein